MGEEASIYSTVKKVEEVVTATVLSLTHRLPSIERTDVFYVVEEGRI